MLNEILKPKFKLHSNTWEILLKLIYNNNYSFARLHLKRRIYFGFI